MVTILGLISQFLGVAIICLFDFSLSSPLPSFVYISFAVCVFLGQTFDAIDGKHARNTNRCSALGQLMDHGCDAFSNCFVSIMISQTFNFGGGFYSVLLLSTIQV
jgi:ethanolaminephosphotransferase